MAVDPTGRTGPTRGEARGPRWRTTSRGLVVPAGVEATPEQRTVEASAVLRGDEAVTGWAALRWAGGRWFDGTVGGTERRLVPVVARRHLTPPPGVAVSQEFLPPAEAFLVDGLAITTAVRSVTFEMRHAATLSEAVVALDMACFDDLVSVAEVAAYLEALGPVTGIQRARDALALADENSWSPLETRLRGIWTMRAGLATPLCNVPVFTLEGQHVGTPDIIDGQSGLLAQYNGALHLTGSRAAADLAKEAAYRDLGLEPVTMVAAEWSTVDAFTRRLVAASRRASARTSPPRWTLEPPPWWTPTTTVAQRRALGKGQQARLLRYRHAA